MAWFVIYHPAVDEWQANLDPDSEQLLIAALDQLRAEGPALKRPLVGAIDGSRHQNMKELRPGSAGRTEIRILFAFDPARQAVLLVAGDKAGQWNKWYRRAIKLADDRYDEHLRRTR